MFNFLSSRFSKSLTKSKNSVLLNAKTVDELINDIYRTLIVADVHQNIARDFVKKLKEKIDINDSNKGKLNSNQYVLRTTCENLREFLTPSNNDYELKINNKLNNILFIGLQGTGKTSTISKLAHYLVNQKAKKVLIVCCDVYRYAAYEQLKILSEKNNLDFFEYDFQKIKDPLKIAKLANDYALEKGYDVVLYDTAGRLETNKELMSELVNLKNFLRPSETLLVLDAYASKSMLSIAESFNKNLQLSGMVVTKMDSDAKAGAVISIAVSLDIAIKFITSGEHITDYGLYNPDQISRSLLGMFSFKDVYQKINLIIDEKSSQKLTQRLFSGNYNFNDLLIQLNQFRNPGKLAKLFSLIPGMNPLKNLTEEQKEAASKKLRIAECLINSMTLEERKNPKLLKNPSRKIRIIKGSGRTAQEFNLLNKKLEQIKETSKRLKSVKNPMLFNSFFK